MNYGYKHSLNVLKAAVHNLNEGKSFNKKQINMLRKALEDLDKAVEYADKYTVLRDSFSSILEICKEED